MAGLRGAAKPHSKKALKVFAYFMSKYASLYAI